MNVVDFDEAEKIWLIKRQLDFIQILISQLDQVPLQDQLNQIQDQIPPLDNDSSRNKQPQQTEV